VSEDFIFERHPIHPGWRVVLPCKLAFTVHEPRTQGYDLVELRTQMLSAMTLVLEGSGIGIERAIRETLTVWEQVTRDNRMRRFT